MKTNIFVVVLFSLISVNNCYSQISYGIKSGINIATIDNLIEFQKNRVGWYVGTFVTLDLSKKWVLEADLLYSSKGTSASKQVGPLEITSRFNYVNVPVLLGYKLHTRSSILIGPELGYLTSVRTFYGKSGNFNTSKNYPSKFDIGLATGLHISIITKLGVEFRYVYGFKTLYYVDDYGVRHSSSKGANRVFQFGVSYKIE
jgi:hypothetical protein